MRFIPLEPETQDRGRGITILKVVGEGSSETVYTDEVNRFLKGTKFKTLNANGGDLQNIWKTTRYLIQNNGIVLMDTDRSAPEELLDFKQWCEERSIALLISNPSFEVWLLMHFEDVASAMDQKDLEHSLDRNLGRKYEKSKGVRPDRTMILEAIRRAESKIPGNVDVFNYIIGHPGTTMAHLLFKGIPGWGLVPS